MNVEFFQEQCMSHTQAEVFGICDGPENTQVPAFLSYTDEKEWVARVENPFQFEVTFTAIDRCIEILTDEGKPGKRCDGMLTYNETVIFVELKQSKSTRLQWVKEAEEQLRYTIRHFERSHSSFRFRMKKAYICNNQRPRFRSSQKKRMEKFFSDTRYILFIEQTINLK